MASLNKVMLIGRTGKEPEVRYSTSGAAIANVSIATDESYKDKSGEKVEKTEWHNLVFFNRTAEVVGEYVTKGMMLFVEGKLQTRKWQDKDGNDRYSTEIVCDRMQMLGSKSEGGQKSSAGETRQSQRDSEPTFNDDDDIPF